MSETVVKERRHPVGGSSSDATLQTSISTLLTDPLDLFHHSITDLDSFSTSLDFDRHLPSVEAREDFLEHLMDEEEICPQEDDDVSLQASFAYDFELERSIPTRLGTIVDADFSEEEEDEDEEEAAAREMSSLDPKGNAPESLSRSNHRAGKTATAQT